MLENNITFLITTYKSQSVINDCLDSIPENYTKIVIENSKDFEMKRMIEKKFKDTKCYVMNNNFGYGKANNFGINKSKTDYVYILNPDTTIDKIEFYKMLEYLKDKDFAICAPIVKEKNNIYDNQIRPDQKYKKVNSVPGMALIINKKKFNNDYFDENIFLYLEEIDLCKRTIKKGEKILQVNSIVYHKGGMSHGDYDYEMEKSRNWHWMWSKFYFQKKYKGFFFSFLIILPSLINLILKCCLLKIMSSNKLFIYESRLSGLLSSILGKKSYYRPNL